MDALKRAIEDLRARYVAANPLSMAADRDAEKYLPGGNTRTVLYFDPFPLTMVAGEGAELTDLDGHRYVDFVGEYSAGLFGHSEEAIKSAVRQSLDGGVAMGAPTAHERQLAELLCTRFPGIDQVRFCNSGTEATMDAIHLARGFTQADEGALHRHVRAAGRSRAPLAGGPAGLGGTGEEEAEADRSETSSPGHSGAGAGASASRRLTAHGGGPAAGRPRGGCGAPAQRHRRGPGDARP